MRVYVCSLLHGRGLIIEANIPVQELEGQRGEGAYFREDMVLPLILLCAATMKSSTGRGICSRFPQAKLAMPMSKKQLALSDLMPMCPLRKQLP